MKKDYFKVVKNFVLSNKISVFFTLIFTLQFLFAGRIWFWSVFSVIPPIFFTVLYLTWLLWITVKKNFYGLSLLLLCLPFAIYSSDVTIKHFTDQPSQDSTTVKVFNWNTEFWEFNEKAKFFQFLVEQQADVYHLQEHILLNKNGYFIELDDQEELKSIFKGYTIVKKTEFLTITKLPVVKSYLEEESYYLRVDVQVGKNVLSLYNVHMPVHINTAILPDVYKFAVDLKHRFDFRNQEFNKLIKDIKSNNNVFYISGDFNTTRSMGKIHEILDLGKDAAYAGDNFFNATWSVNDIRVWRIDFNIVHNGLKVLHYKELNPGSLSDHWAQLVTIQL